jgi:hypothetical protein
VPEDVQRSLVTQKRGRLSLEQEQETLRGQPLSAEQWLLGLSDWEQAA